MMQTLTLSDLLIVSLFCRDNCPLAASLHQAFFRIMSPSFRTGTIKNIVQNTQSSISTHPGSLSHKHPNLAPHQFFSIVSSTEPRSPSFLWLVPFPPTLIIFYPFPQHKCFLFIFRPVLFLWSEGSVFRI